MQTGEWIYLGNESSTLKSALRRVASSNETFKTTNLTGSQIVKLSLFPNKKNGIGNSSKFVYPHFFFNLFFSSRNHPRSRTKQL